MILTGETEVLGEKLTTCYLVRIQSKMVCARIVPVFCGKTEINLSCIQKTQSVRHSKHSSPGYKNQPLNVVV